MKDQEYVVAVRSGHTLGGGDWRMTLGTSESISAGWETVGVFLGLTPTLAKPTLAKNLTDGQPALTDFGQNWCFGLLAFVF